MRSAGSFTSAYLNGWQGETHLQHCHLCERYPVLQEGGENEKEGVVVADGSGGWRQPNLARCWMSHAHRLESTC